MSLRHEKIEVVDHAVADRLRLMTAAQRLAVANRMWVSAHKAMTHILRSEHPNWTDQQVQRETARRCCMV